MHVLLLCSVNIDLYIVVDYEQNATWNRQFLVRPIKIDVFVLVK